MIAGVEIENRSCDPDHGPFKGGLSSVESICMQNLTIVAVAVREMSLGTQKFKVGHVTLTTPI